jgi:hypothetical protein
MACWQARVRCAFPSASSEQPLNCSTESAVPCCWLQYRVCNATVGLQSVPCGQICMPLAPKMKSAIFENDGRTVTVTLNQAAAGLNVPCARLFDAETVAKLGSLSQCTGQWVLSGSSPAGCKGCAVCPGGPPRVVWLACVVLAWHCLQRLPFTTAAVSTSTMNITLIGAVTLLPGDDLRLIGGATGLLKGAKDATYAPCLALQGLGHACVHPSDPRPCCGAMWVPAVP